MIYLFSGDDAKNKLSSYERFIKSIPKETEIFKFGRNDFDRNQITSFCSGPGLFFKKSLVVFSNLFEYEETRDFLLGKLPLMGQAENSFVFLEGKLNKSILDAFERAGPERTELNIFELPKIKTEKFDNFLLSGAFGARDKKSLWIHFRQAADLGVTLEELTGVLFWKAKNMLIKKNFSKFSETELKNSIEKLSYLLPEARYKSTDAEAAFERFLLEAF